MEAEFLRLFLLYPHLLACCIAVGSILLSDYETIKHWRNPNIEELNDLTKIVSISLIALWITGLMLVGFDVAQKGAIYYENPKLQAKLLVVSILTLNGIWLHTKILPWITKAKSVVDLSFNKMLMAATAGAISGVSWLYAVFLGIAKPLSWKFPLEFILAPYPLMITGGIIATLGLTLWHRAEKEELID